MIRALLLAALLAPPAYAGWIYAGDFHVPDGEGTGEHNLPRLNTHEGQMLPESRWFLIDLMKNGVPNDATAAFIQGQLILTHGTTEEICYLQMYARKPGTPITAFHAFGQVIETSTTGGQRSPISFIIPLVDGKFEMHWSRTNQGQWPLHCAYAINLRVAGYWR